jgi:hypothetical protein
MNLRQKLKYACEGSLVSPAQQLLKLRKLLPLINMRLARSFTKYIGMDATKQGQHAFLTSQRCVRLRPPHSTAQHGSRGSSSSSKIPLF